MYNLTLFFFFFFSLELLQCLQKLIDKTKHEEQCLQNFRNQEKICNGDELETLLLLLLLLECFAKWIDKTKQQECLQSFRKKTEDFQG
jgi:hypothetical protein